MRRTFQVWAPAPKNVELVMGNERMPMERSEDGWWRAVVEGCLPGTDYGYRLDGGGPFPDPRSPWQPDGVHGLSRLVDTEDFAWTDETWQAPPLSAAVIYELHIGTFTPAGTFEAAIEKLGHLVELGVTHLELMPVNEFPGTRGWGYDGVDLFAPHHSYGGPAGLKRLVNACHARGLAVLLDVVYNHIGPIGNYLGRYGPYFSARHQVPWGEAMNFDGPDSGEVRRFFRDNALMWLRDYHFDGLRLDAVQAIIDLSAEHFLEELAREVEQLEGQLGRKLALIAESDLNDPRLIRAREGGGFGLDAQWNDDFHHSLHTVLTGENDGYYADFGTLGDLCQALREAFVYGGRYSVFRRRRHGRVPAGLSGHRFVGYLQDHDQIGNRARGERSSQLMTVGRLKIGAALVFASPFVPMMFQGEEWGASTPFQFFTDYQEPGLAMGVREARCQEFASFGWDPGEIPDPQAAETFTRSKLNWDEVKRQPHAGLLEWHRQLIRLRRAEAALTDGRRDLVRTRHDELRRWLVLERGDISVVCNLGSRPECIPLEPGVHVLLLASDSVKTLEDGILELPPGSVAILKSRAAKECRESRQEKPQLSEYENTSVKNELGGFL